MKKLYKFNRRAISNAEKIAKIIDGVIVSGDRYAEFFDVVNRPVFVKKPNTLVFLYYLADIRIARRLNRFENCIVVYQEGSMVENFLPHLTYIKVRDMWSSYWKFIDYYRSLWNIPLFAITGTCGKTTTKEMIKHILSSRMNVQATYLSNNTTLSHLEYLVGITERTDVAVFETPVSGPGLLAETCRFFRPTIGMITNIGVDHLLYCKTLDNYIQSKGEIVRGLNYEGTLILNSDDDRIKKIPLKDYKGKLIYFGIENQADFVATDIQYTNEGMQFVVQFQELRVPVTINEFGRHQVYNALGAIAAVYQIGVSITEAAKRLSTFHNIQSHLEVFESFNGSMIIDDTWSSNPTSLEVAIEAWNNIGSKRRKVALLGEMSLLGDKEVEIHQSVGKLIAENNIDVLITYGELAKEIATGARMHGMNGVIHTCNDAAEVENSVLPYLDNKSSVLLKVSMYDKSITSLVTKLKKGRKNLGN
ncbi:hypothetical protein BTR25_12150 [Bacillus sp. MRMR6]|nr:hypothetical protein BTR25_12150 [Bacillus sp. MRMR6]